LSALADAPAQELKKIRKAKRVLCSAGSSTVLARYKTDKAEALPFAIPKPLTRKPGDPERGLEAVVNPGKGNCLACHHIAKVLAKVEEDDTESMKKYGNHGEIGPPLNGVGARYTQAELRMIIVDPKKAFPDADTIMPAYHARPANKDISRACRGRVALSAQAVEDIVAFLEELK
jgi:sulfur-oxidizing protein SoxX